MVVSIAGRRSDSDPARTMNGRGQLAAGMADRRRCRPRPFIAAYRYPSSFKKATCPGLLPGRSFDDYRASRRCRAQADSSLLVFFGAGAAGNGAAAGGSGRSGSRSGSRSGRAPQPQPQPSAPQRAARAASDAGPALHGEDGVDQVGQGMTAAALLLAAATSSRNRKPSRSKRASRSRPASRSSRKPSRSSRGSA